MAIYSDNYDIQINDIGNDLLLSNYGFLRLLQEAAGRASASVRLWTR